MARPTKEQKYSANGQKQLIREICGDALLLIHQNIQDLIAEQQKRKKDKLPPLAIDLTSLGNFVGKLLPIVMDENVENEDDLTMDMLIKKHLKVSLRIQEANEEGLREEDPTVSE